MSWSIGIYGGAKPFQLGPHPEASNPVLTHEHLTDFPSVFVADPFMVHEGDTWYMFFEAMGLDNVGVIGLATSSDALHWKYQRIVLREPFHLSYPHVFKWAGEYYMTPETLGAKAARLYRADPFPERWAPVADLVPGALADPTVFRYGDSWRMLACGTPYGHDSLRLFESAELTRGWVESARSPLVVENRRIARPAGRVTPWEGRLIRFAQDCYPTYGSRVRAFSMDFSASAHTENELPQPVLLAAPGAEWTAAGMHHVDPHDVSSTEWIACVDGTRE